MIDCTLRDGEQAPGVVFTIDEKLQIATSLSRAGVNLLDAGFPAGGGEEIETLQELRRLGLNARIGVTARPFRSDVAAADKAMAQEVFLFMPTSDSRIEKTLGMTRERAVELFRDGAEDVVGRGMTLNVVFEDSTRADPRFLGHFVEQIAVSVPVTRVIIADTVGCARPDTMTSLIRDLRAALDPAVRICPHCHNDFGLASANTLAAVAAGAESVTCTVNGLGERAGNADLAEVAVGLRYLYGIEHSIDLVEMQRLSQLVERVSGVHTSFTKPVTGLNVFRHESGVHVDAMLKSVESYEFLPSSAVGRKTEFVLGKHSGSALIRYILDEPGAEAVDEDTVKSLLAMVKHKLTQSGKTEHERFYAQRQQFFADNLCGIDHAELARLMVDGQEPEAS